jgi:hypothetical protein
LTFKETNLWDYLFCRAFYKTPWHHNTKCANHWTLIRTLLSLNLPLTKLIATHHPCDSCIDIHGHTYHFSNEHHHSCSSFQRPFIQSAQFWIMHQQERSSFQSPLPHWTNFHQHPSIHPSMVRKVEYLIMSMTRTPCWKKLWSYGSTLIFKLFYTKMNWSFTLEMWERGFKSFFIILCIGMAFVPHPPTKWG